MAPFEAFTSFLRGDAKTVNQVHRSEQWLRDNAMAIVHLAALSLAKGGETFSFDELCDAAQELSKDIPINRERVAAALADADVERAGEGRLRVVA